MARIQVVDGKNLLVEEMPVEIVERKGRGHPDSLCDGAAEELSVALCKFYREKVGRHSSKPKRMAQADESLHGEALPEDETSNCQAKRGEP